MINNVKIKTTDKYIKKMYTQEKIVKTILQTFSAASILVTLGIVVTLFSETVSFFTEVSIFEFLFTTKWTPTLAPKHFGVIPLVIGTLMIALMSSVISIPIGLGSAIYLSEFAPANVRKVVKPVLEILAGIPSIVYGFFALNFITPFLRVVFNDVEVFNAMSAAIAVGIMTMPMVASLSEDAMKAVPDAIREGAYALGSTKFEVAVKVVLPAALSNIVSSFVLAISRAVGETMIVAIAAGANSNLTLNPLKSIQTMTGYMVNISLGDIAHGSVEYKTVFAVGFLLFIMTLFMNILARHIVAKYREEY
ncbi:phosphate ABC transporter membrane protein 1, PhoT family (TC 3.A.1.7.1) [Peptoclostridium litorale DSM 5388]|uniref:Phosphate transport system permease protein n=1 Tax=Peptoclostridium litorale DSM 5388 TaxID=1121324 RepID=A0A069RM51_PEPLI|nr:phosphate ABC transporter permease subunit PstC [Peptoclostridium litorale]KDR93855.1 phosphate ABC transporter, inner membrane subunit PstC [Peptoclostridium litorale DSM 5388]KDR95282.1 phosphate ABC transporter, inner membrane subunit PstC [Peptoclostridium litorale DSM 5388]SIN87210.1 phosphate ABC transporter membrane protein 1, PhoT family (TC 3.A.1.7.1) [Peptoclostridium litorale DSM 5388]